MILCACEPITLPGDGGELEGSSGGDSASDGSQGGSTGGDGPSGTGGVTAPTTGFDGSTGGEGHDTGLLTEPTTATSGSGEPPEDSGGPRPASLKVLPLHLESGPQSALEGIALWESAAPPDGCDDPPPAECGELPTLGTPQLLVDGEFTDAVELSDSVAVLFPFAHPACQLGCADFTLTMLIGEGGDGGQMIGALPVDVPCSTADSDVWIGLDFNRVTLPQPYTARLQLTDRCGASTESAELVFTPQ